MDGIRSTIEFEVYTPAVEITHKRSKYTCDDDGLRKYGASFQADLSEYLPILLKNGSINKGKSRHQKQQSPDWWRSQCAFRGLSTSGRIEELQARLRSGPNTMTKELVELEKKGQAEWKVKEAFNQSKALQEYNDQQHNDEQQGLSRLKAIFDNDNEMLASLFKKKCQGLDRAAKKLGLHHQWIRSPAFSLTFEWDDDWIIVGRTVSDVKAKVAAVKQQEDDRILAHETREEEKEKAARAAERRLHDSIANLSAKTGDWDVTGVWKITCPEFHARNYLGKQEPKLWIYRLNGTKVSQMFAKFDFLVVTGWLRFEDPAVQSLPAASVGQKRKRRAWDSYLIPLDMKPSPDRPVWSYRWRGTPDEGYPEASDEDECSITFSGKGGCTLSGIFRSSWLDCEFTGVKLGTANPVEASRISVDDEWESLIPRDG
jgi:hypothetical protein